MERVFSTPMMKQYSDIKEKYKDCLLFFRLGDFYELFLDDAIIGAKVLDITLTRRPRGKDGDIPMAGVPYHAADIYIAKLVKAGYKVAICEQVSEPDAKGIVDREVIRIVTPGTILDEKTLTQKEHNYTMSISLGDDALGIAVADISTGDFLTCQFHYNGTFTHLLLNEIARFSPSECIVSKEIYALPHVLKVIRADKNINIYPFPEWETHAEQAETLLKRHFNVKTLKGYGLGDKAHALKASGALLGYLSHVEKTKVGHIKSIRTYAPDEYVVLDASTISNLELFRTIREGDEKGSFINCIDKTETAMGGRLLRSWVREPLRNKNEIEKRLKAVEELLHNRVLREKARTTLSGMYDIERILSRLSVGLGNPCDLINLSTTLKKVALVFSTLSHLSSQYFKHESLHLCEHISAHIDTTLTENPPFDPKAGGVIKPNVHEELDRLREQIRDSQEWIASLEGKERKRTGIGNLKVRFNKVFGYYIEVSKSYVSLVPPDYIRKQTTVNGERFITPELKEYEDKVLRGEEVIHKLEYELFSKLVEHVLTHTEYIQELAGDVATIDCLSSFAFLAERGRYAKPTITTDGSIVIEDGRHPVVEQLEDMSFVPNNTLLNPGDHNLLVITGPNMAGKSVYMRQVALIVLMAHMGSFVPARKASISLVDRIFVRSGAADSIGRGLSTFMVEMVETAHILHHATHDSLIIMDEIGRGTSTYDGISIAWAIAEHLINHVHAKTLFATHYHELQDLEREFPKHIKNYHMAVEEHADNPLFLYRIVPGGAAGSYAIAVAKLAGVPEDVTKRAQELLNGFNTQK